MAKNIREGYWRSTEQPRLPMPRADERWPDHEVFANLLFLVEARLEKHPDNYALYRGTSRCRCCGAANGSAEFTYGGYVWPSGFMHYITKHRVKPSDGFIQMIGKAALTLHSEPVLYDIEHGPAELINAVHSSYRNDTIAALVIDTSVRNVSVVGTGSSSDVPTVFLELVKGTTGVETCIAFPQFEGWSVFAAQRIKYGCNVVLVNNEPQEENNDAVA